MPVEDYICGWILIICKPFDEEEDTPATLKGEAAKVLSGSQKSGQYNFEGSCPLANPWPVNPAVPFSPHRVDHRDLASSASNAYNCFRFHAFRTASE